MAIDECAAWPTDEQRARAADDRAAIEPQQACVLLGQSRLPFGKSTGEAAIAKRQVDAGRAKRGEVFVLEE